MILDPKGIAVVGASREKKKVGHIVFKNLLKSRVKAYPVNPKTRTVLGEKSYKSVLELKGKVSHAVIAVPARIVPQVINECGAAGMKTAIIISAGFSEVGNKELEEKVINNARKHGIRVLGPNVLGVVVPGEFNASFFEGEISKGGVSFISQSGALGVGVLDMLIERGWGLRSFISIGNAGDITVTDALREVLNDKGTSCVILYVESLEDGNEFMKVCKGSDKPVFVLKAGTSKAGKRAAATHTGSLAGSDKVYNAAIKQCGARRVHSLSSLINAGMTFDKNGCLFEKALVITNAGGPGILMTDSLAKVGVKIPRLPKKLVDRLNKDLKGVCWSRNNPIDVVGDAQADRYAKVLNAISRYQFYDEVIVLLTPQAMTEPLKTAKELVNFAKKTKKPVLPCFIGGPGIKEAVDYMEDNGLMVFDRIDELAVTIKLLIGRQQ